jgi:hypothetical protein
MSRDLHSDPREERDQTPARNFTWPASARTVVPSGRNERPKPGLEVTVMRRSRASAEKLDPMERQILTTIGKFRSVNFEDIQSHLEREFPVRGVAAFSKLKLMGLIRMESIRPRGDVQLKRPVLSTRYAKQIKGTVLKQQRSVLPTYQIVYLARKARKALVNAGYERQVEGSIGTGLQKHKELFHDSKLFQMTQIEIQALTTQGASGFRIETDMDLKARVNQQTQNLAKTIPMKDAKRKAAEDNQLAILNDKIMFPDVRLEYRDVQGNQSRVDLELTSDSYSKAQVAGKRAAGMKCYALKGVGHSITDDHDHMQEIFSI